ncbi:MAG: hypothetical protein ABSB67_02895 [Bryobacteraceae bacterium]|jgi:hypothetical protein
MPSQSGGEQQLQAAAAQAMSGAPWQSSSDNSTTESLTQALVQALQDTTNSVNNLTTFEQTQTSSAAQSVETVLSGVSGGQSLLSSVASGAGGLAGDLLSGGGLLSPIISGIESLFGGSSNTPASLETFTMPPSLNVDATGGTSTGGQLAGSDYGSNGIPRAQTTSQAASGVTVQVNAMDSRSFLDRSSDIATAVRQAILNSHSINDVLSEL